MTTTALRAVAIVVLALAPVIQAAGLGADWVTRGGEWGWTREVIQMIRQRRPTGTSVAFCRKVSGTHGAWRATLGPAFGTKEAGIWIQGSEGLKSGFLVVVGGTDGFALRSADGKTLWKDRWAPWQWHLPNVAEGVVERGRVRAQLFEGAGNVLVSQSPWVNVSEQATETPGHLGLYTHNSIARFWSFEHAGKPLSPIVADAPNKRRIVQSDDSPWIIVSPGNWMWKTAKKQRVRQYADVERTKIIYRGVQGALRRWTCRIKADPGTAGLGLFFQSNETATEGFITWLCGRPPSGRLMLVRLPTKTIWGGGGFKWRYNTEYVLAGETRKGAVRAQIIAADGKTVLKQSPWVKFDEAATAKAGYIGFHTWRGKAEFWGWELK